MTADAFQFTVYCEPEGKARPRVTRFGTFTPKATRDFEAMVRFYFEGECNSRSVLPSFPLRGPLQVQLLCSFRRPASVKRTFHTVKPDWDNCAKAVLDALNGRAWKDDSQIMEAMVRKDYADEETPRIIVRIKQLCSEDENEGKHRKLEGHHEQEEAHRARAGNRAGAAAARPSRGRAGA